MCPVAEARNTPTVIPAKGAQRPRAGTQGHKRWLPHLSLGPGSRAGMGAARYTDASTRACPG